MKLKKKVESVSTIKTADTAAVDKSVKIEKVNELAKIESVDEPAEICNTNQSPKTWLYRINHMYEFIKKAYIDSFLSHRVVPDSVIDSKESSSYSFICKNVNKALEELIKNHENSSISNRFDISSSIRDKSWRPPSRHGLENSNRIIPNYYFTNHTYDKIFNIDYYYMIKDDIKNMRPLNKHQIDYIKKLDDKNKNEIIEEMIIINQHLLEICDTES